MFKKRAKHRKDKYFWHIVIERIPEDQVEPHIYDYHPDRWTWDVHGPVGKIDDLELKHICGATDYHETGSAPTHKKAEQAAERMRKTLSRFANEPYTAHRYYIGD